MPPNEERFSPMGQWLVIYEDQDAGMAVFDDETEARTHFDEARQNWSCRLYRLEATG